MERYNECVERPKAFEELGRQIQLFMKVVEAFNAKVSQTVPTQLAFTCPGSPNL